MVHIYTLTSEITSPISKDKLVKALIIDYQNFIPKAAPRIVQSIESITGDGGPGSTKNVSFAPGQKYTYAKIEVVISDSENSVFNFTAIEGDVLEGGKILKIDIELKIEVSAEGKSILKIKFVYYTDDFKLPEEYIKAVHENIIALYKAVEKYIIIHPNYA